MHKLRTKRLEAGMRQSDAASLLGIGAETYRRFEDGRQEPKLNLLIKMANLFRCRVEDLIDDYNIN